MNTELPTHMKSFMDHLRSMPPGDATSFWDFAEHYHDELEGFESAMDLLSEGHPIYFSTHEGRWINNASPEAIHYHKATRPEGLDGVATMIRNQMCYLRRLLSGLQQARHNLHESEQTVTSLDERNPDVE